MKTGLNFDFVDISQIGIGTASKLPYDLTQT